MKPIFFLWLTFFAIVPSMVSAASFSDEALVNLTAGYEARREKSFAALKGKPLVKRKIEAPLFAGQTTPLYRNYCYSLVDFAFKCFWLNEQNKEANAALSEYASVMFDKPEVLLDGDAVIWSADELCRIISYFGKNGSKSPGLLNTETEEQLYKVMWQYASKQSRLESEYKAADDLLFLAAKPSLENLWDIEGSENIHLMRVYTKWHFSQFLKDWATYQNLEYEEGGKAVQHYETWSKYLKAYITERSTKGLFVEFANDDYGTHAIKNIYGLFDFSQDPELKKLAKNFLDLFWATWSQEQIDGVRGGAKARVYRGIQSIMEVSPLRKAAYFSMGIGSSPELKENLFSFATTTYRLPFVVMDIALDREGRGAYEITQRCLGLAQDGMHSPQHYRIKQDDGLVRTSYCTPEFIAGTFQCDPHPDDEWAMISSQNRWAGITFYGDVMSRIFPQAHTEYRAYNTLWCLQAKGAMVFQKLPEGSFSKLSGEMRVYFSDNGLKNFVEKSDWVFVESAGAYVAVKVSKGKSSWLPVEEKYQNKTLWKGRWLVAEDDTAAVLMDVARKTDYQSYEAFQQKILSLPFENTSKSLLYKSSYGDTLEFFYSQSKRGLINGTQVDLTPKLAFDSPFLTATWGSKKIKIKKEGRSLELDF